MAGNRAAEKLCRQDGCVVHKKRYDARVAKRTALTSVRTSRQRSSIRTPLVLAFPKAQRRVYKSKECIYVEASPMQAYA